MAVVPRRVVASATPVRVKGFFILAPLCFHKGKINKKREKRYRKGMITEKSVL
jgi:hypothetical protein